MSVTNQINSLISDPNSGSQLHQVLCTFTMDTKIRDLFFNAIGPAALVMNKKDIENLRIAISIVYLLGIRKGEQNALEDAYGKGESKCL